MSKDLCIGPLSVLESDTPGFIDLTESETWTKTDFYLRSQRVPV